MLDQVIYRKAAIDQFKMDWVSTFCALFQQFPVEYEPLFMLLSQPTPANLIEMPAQISRSFSPNSEGVLCTDSSLVY